MLVSLPGEMSAEKRKERVKKEKKKIDKRSSPLGLGELQACPFPDVVFLPPFLSALSSSRFRRAWRDGLGQKGESLLARPYRFVRINASFSATVEHGERH